MKALIALVASVFAAVALVCISGFAFLTGASACTTPPATTPAAASGINPPQPAAPDTPAVHTPHGTWNADQLHNATIIAATGAARGVPTRGQIIALATAMQESSLRNLGHLGDNNDHDSLGLFQQRPSQGWGTPAQILDPVYASGKFYDKLLTIPAWQTMTVKDAAQAVQGSLYPDRYAQWETAATQLYAAVGSGPGGVVPGGIEQCASTDGWALPAPGRIVSGWRTPDRPTHAGVDIGAPRGIRIRAAAAGTVITVACNVSEGTCDTDGSPAVKGCGYYVEIAHGQGVTTRYCHMLRRPTVSVGQTVIVGQPIGVVGSSGNSSGPHLHFEVRVNGVDIDPVRHLAERGVHVGQPT